MLVTLATIGALSCSAAAAERDRASVLFLAAATRGGPGLARDLGLRLPERDALAWQIEALDRRLRHCKV